MHPVPFKRPMDTCIHTHCRYTESNLMHWCRLWKLRKKPDCLKLLFPVHIDWEKIKKMICWTTL